MNTFNFEGNTNAAYGATVQRQTGSEKSAHATQFEETLRILKRHGGWVTRDELMVVTHRFSACIQSLRQLGHVIDSRKNELTKQYEWRYSHSVEVCQVTDDWQEAYYRSPHWRAKRTERMNHDDFRCCNCHRKESLQVHHWKYDLFAELLGDLMTFCENCHQRIHRNVRIGFPKVVTSEVFERLDS